MVVTVFDDKFLSGPAHCACDNDYRSGEITFVNPYFIEVSGFTEQELIVQPHNLVRHPADFSRFSCGAQAG